MKMNKYTPTSYYYSTVTTHFNSIQISKFIQEIIFL